MELRKRYYNGVQIADVLIRHIDRPETIMNCLNNFSNLEVDDVAPVKRGRWELKYHKLWDKEFPTCTVCGNPFYATRYCPNCGAKMGEEVKP